MEVLKVAIPRRGMASDTCGRVSVTMLWKTVSESRMVTPETTNMRSSNAGSMTRQNGGESARIPRFHRHFVCALGCILDLDLLHQGSLL